MPTGMSVRSRKTLITHPHAQVRQSHLEDRHHLIFAVVKLSKRVTSPARLQNRTCVFQRIRLLNDLAFAIGTGYTFCMSFIVAVSMECKFIAQFFSTPFIFWCDVIDFYQVSILKKESTP